jgi:hypothetical protein
VWSTHLRDSRPDRRHSALPELQSCRHRSQPFYITPAFAPNQKDIPIFRPADCFYSTGYSGFISIFRERLDVWHRRFGNLYFARSDCKVSVRSRMSAASSVKLLENVAMFWA